MGDCLMFALIKNNEFQNIIYSSNDWVDLKPGYKVSPPVSGWSQEIDGDVYSIQEYTPPPVEEPIEDTEE